MNYAIHYERLIARARDRVLDGYRERHHVLPRCMGGGNELINLVELTAEEHYVAHQLLVKIYPESKTLVHAAVMMSGRCSGNKAYGWLRRRNADASRNIPKSPEHCAKLSRAHLGMRASPETRAKMSLASKGKAKTPEHCVRVAAGLRGKKKSLEHVKQMSLSRLGKKRRQVTWA